jgi:hypothetical protein
MTFISSLKKLRTLLELCIEHNYWNAGPHLVYLKITIGNEPTIAIWKSTKNAKEEADGWLMISVAWSIIRDMEKE